MSCAPTAPGTALNDVGACPVWASAGEFIKRPLPANHTTRPTASADTIVKAFLMVVLPAKRDGAGPFEPALGSEHNRRLAMKSITWCAIRCLSIQSSLEWM